MRTMQAADPGLDSETWDTTTMQVLFVCTTCFGARANEFVLAILFYRQRT